ncbi:MAG: bifunctional (p)ppGpp synthetase/guanosine-3',5'-bis(diphosphate) 3'-pyrophosphohydrolase, partial [Oscillospiraceae bacterium]|nr:bifunctional (p)ppGpp synthetase/guanosine-3',5'-bis(diphosphate) 3'-pyrophosphohydrolase [Oscillospiraceae bacterium]
QKRHSGEQYIIHPLGVAFILADMELDITSICAALLHDVLEDTEYSKEQMVEDFGKEITELVEGVTKLTNIQYSTVLEKQAENIRKMFVAMAKDIRVILIKLADRLHNMRTLGSMERRKQLEKACETMEIYAPLAHRLGMAKLKWELEDISLQYLDPQSYKEISENIKQKRQERERYLENLKNMLSAKCAEMGIKCEIQSRAKHFYSIYLKMHKHNIPIEQIYDLLALRVIVDNLADCYAVLGMVHELYQPIPGRFKDYIAMPKKNMYQSLHTSLIGPEGKPFEVQIRTWNMHNISEVGIAAHWNYKEGGGKKAADEKFAWIRQLIDDYKGTGDSEEIVSSLKVDLFENEVFIFSPRGDLVSLPFGSNPIDFAYSIHSQVGDKAVGCKINSQIKPIDTILKNGDIVEIITAKNGTPSLDWLKTVKTTSAKRKINDYFKKENREENIARGKAMLEKELKKERLSELANAHIDKWQPPLLKKFSIKEIDDIYAMIGFGGISVLKIITRIREYLKDVMPKKEEEFKNLPIADKKISTQEIIVHGIENCLIRYAKCCNPVHGDGIVGYITRGRGVTIHRSDCSTIDVMEEDKTARLIEAEWGTGGKTSTYNANLRIVANSKVGILASIAGKISEMKLQMVAIESKVLKDDIVIFNVVVQITDKSQLEKLVTKLTKLKDCIEVQRNIN